MYKPKKLEDMQKLHVRAPQQRTIMYGVVIKELAEPVVVGTPGEFTVIGRYNFDPEVRGTSLA